jgi:hypothetical protein
MIKSLRPLIALAGLSGPAGCAGADAALDQMDAQIETRSTCHTSTGQWIGGPSCTISHSVSRTTSTTTTTVTTTPAAAAPEGE